MSIWFYFSIIFLIVIFILIIKIFVIKKSIRDIEKEFNFIIESDTNSLITNFSNDTDIKNLSRTINKNLRKIRKLEIEYNQGNQELKKSITNISHDLRTPLTAIRGYLELLDNKNLTEKQKEYLKYIEIKAKDLTNLTEQLFDFSKSLDSFNELNKSDVCLNNLLEEVICSFYDLFTKNNIIPDIYITNKKIIKNVDLNMIKRIFENIISNAIKYSEDNFKITLDDSGIVHFSNKTSNVNLIDLEKIFDRYYTVENGKKSTGIGLSIAKQLVELNGGEIDASYDNNELDIALKF